MTIELTLVELVVIVLLGGLAVLAFQIFQGGLGRIGKVVLATFLVLLWISLVLSIGTNIVRLG